VLPKQWKMTFIINGISSKFFLCHNISVFEIVNKISILCTYFRATTLYDRPGPQFKTITLFEKHNLLEKMNLNDFTELSESGEVQLKPDRPSLLVSSTSWTPDEDFSILLKALQSIHTITYIYYWFIIINWMDHYVKFICYS